MMSVWCLESVVASAVVVLLALGAGCGVPQADGEFEEQRGAVRCFELDESSCIQDARCMAVEGRPYVTGQGCKQPLQFAYCTEAGRLCGNPVFAKSSPQGACWLFFSECQPFPAGWTDPAASSDTCFVDDKYLEASDCEGDS